MKQNTERAEGLLAHSRSPENTSCNSHSPCNSSTQQASRAWQVLVETCTLPLDFLSYRASSCICAHEHLRDLFLQNAASISQDRRGGKGSVLSCQEERVDRIDVCERLWGPGAAAPRTIPNRWRMVAFSDWLDLQLIVRVTSVGKLIFGQSPSKDGDLGTTHYPVFDFHFEEKRDPREWIDIVQFHFSHH